MYNVQGVKTQLRVLIYKGIQDIQRKKEEGELKEIGDQGEYRKRIEDTWALSIEDEIEYLEQLCKATLCNISYL